MPSIEGTKLMPVSCYLHQSISHWFEFLWWFYRYVVSVEGKLPDIGTCSLLEGRRRYNVCRFENYLPSFLKFTAKQLERSSKKCEKEEKAQQAKVKKVDKLWSLSELILLHELVNFLKLSLLSLYSKSNYFHILIGSYLWPIGGHTHS